MIVKQAEFVVSNTDYRKCPPPNKPEFAFIGRSNVGKSSLINMLVDRRNLAKTSATPGKTQTINHFVVNNHWYLVDLPGYGYASVSQTARKSWGKMIEDYILKRENLYCTFVLIDARHEPQKNDLQFITWLGEQGIPMAIVMTKSDKLSLAELKKSKKIIETTLLKTWETLPPLFVTSAEKKLGQQELLNFIEDAIRQNNENV